MNPQARVGVILGSLLWSSLDFTVSYLFSTFQPYDSVLFSMDLQAVTHWPPGHRHDR